MGENTKIEWCDHTHNFWVGCTKISPACDFCYAESWAKQSGHPELWQGERRRTKTWRDPHRWNLDRLGINRPRARVFSNSLADFFDNQVPQQWRREAWHVIDQTPNLDWLILTKRPQNIAKMLPEEGAGYSQPWGEGWPNVWFGTTCENQEVSDRNIPILLATSAAVRFVSLEPLLGPIDLMAILRQHEERFMRPLDGRFKTLDWVICGGESGPNARPMRPQWARDLRDQCSGAGVLFFFKQWGEFAPQGLNSERWLWRPDNTCARDPIPNGIARHLKEGFSVSYRVGKKAAGRLLDGRTWDEMPMTSGVKS